MKTGRNRENRRGIILILNKLFSMARYQSERGSSRGILSKLAQSSVGLRPTDEW